MKNPKANSTPNSQDAFAALPGLAHVKRAMEVAVAGGHSITIVDCNGYSVEYRAAFETLTPVKNGVVDQTTLPGFTVLQPCPCGNLTHPERACVCSAAVIRRHQKTASFHKGINADIVVAAGYIRAWDFDTNRNEDADTVRKRIGAIIEASSTLTEDANRIMDRAYSVLHLNANERDRAVRTARTIAGLDGSEHIEARHVAEAVQYVYRGLF